MSIFRKERDCVQKQIDKIKQELSAKKKHRDEVINLPNPLSDIAEMVCEKIDAEAEVSRTRLEQGFSFAKSCYIETESVPSILECVGAGTSGKVMPMHLYSLLGDPIKKEIRKIVMSWDWPDKVGPPRHERKEYIDNLDDEIEALEDKLDNIILKADSDGMRVIF